MMILPGILRGCRGDSRPRHSTSHGCAVAPRRRSTRSNASRRYQGAVTQQGNEGEMRLGGVHDRERFINRELESTILVDLMLDFWFVN